MNVSRIVLAAGGTGGHMFPAEALAGELLKRGFAVDLVTDRRGQAFGDRLGEVAVHRVHAAGVIGRTLGRKLQSVLLLILGTLQARWLIRRLQPHVVVGFGGYASFPTLLAATHAGCATVLHEQNAVLGRANKMLATRARAIATSFPETRDVRPADTHKLVHTGNPVRPAVIGIANQPYPALHAEGGLRLMVTGGSQGARIFSDVVPAAIASLPKDMRSRLFVSQQCRPEDLDRVARIYDEAEVTADLAAFFSDLPRRLGAAHLGICRAGASTVAELTVAGLPAILVPLASSDEHQTANATFVEQAGGAWVVAQKDFTAPILARRLFGLLRDPDTLIDAAARARAIGIPDAATRLADLVQSLGEAA
jgi:UDP-N-acetylglucosamine--N-acetylmuramyl-(pentapeptide) pyrophosphoryl-undecaprenol N-acetylglucosamine transferase